MALQIINSLTTSTKLTLSSVSVPFNASNRTIDLINDYDSSNATQYSIFEMILIAIVAGMLSIITVIGNIMVMISFKMDKQLQTISNYFLLSLAIADFSIGLISMPLFTMYILIGWPLGHFICDSWLAFDYLNSNASVLNLLIISFDRYFSVTRPLTYRALRTTRRATVMIASAWVISLMLWPPWIYAWPYIEGKRTVKENDCYIQFLVTNPYVTFGTALAAFYVPVTVMCFLYWRIWRETKQRQKDLTNLQAGKKEDSRKSTSSDDPPDHVPLAQKTEETKFRTDSCIIDESLETTYVPTSLCVETSKYLPKRAETKRGKLRDLMRNWCRQDREGEAQDEDSTSHDSPATTPASLETPMQACSRTASMSFRMQPLQTQTTVPAGERIERRKEAKEGNPGQSSPSLLYSPDSVYTILIRLPPKVEGEASIKMIVDDKASDRTQKPAEAIRLPLNTKLVHKQVARPRPPKKKRKQHERKQDMKAAKTLSAILFAFTVTWTPYNVLVLYKTLADCDNDDCITPGLWNFAYYLCYINSTVNPFCYALCNATFRRTYTRILSCKWHNKRTPLDSRGFFT